MANLQSESDRLTELLDALSIAENILGRVAQGDLSFALPSGKSEVENQVHHSFDAMRKQLAAMIRELAQYTYHLHQSTESLTGMFSTSVQRTRAMDEQTRSVAADTEHMSINLNTVASAAEELSVNMATVSDRTERSTSKIVDVSNAIGQMTATIGEIARNSEQARETVSQAVESVKNATAIMAELSKAASGINYVTSTISGISDQTKLLALNATIEAARAGEAGSRFGVVANEVKALAGETNKATKDIQEKVEIMQKASRSALDEINRISEVINNVDNVVSVIATAVEEQSSTTKEISGHVQQVAEGIQDVTRAVSEANIAVQEVTTNITQAAQLSNDVSAQITKTAQDSSMLRENTSGMYAEAMEVSSRAEDIQRVVNMFRLPPEYKIDKGPSVLFRFSEFYSVHVKDLDQQHRKIFDYMNEIHEAIKRKTPPSGILSTLKEMQAFTAQHFADEERKMQTIHYSGFDGQKTAHTKLLNQLADNITKLDRGEEINLIELLRFLKDWLVNHIVGSDMKYASPMNQAGMR